MVTVIGVLKGIALVILSFLLFTSLTSYVFLNAFLGTALDAGFVTQEIKKANLYDSFTETISSQLSQQAAGVISQQDLKAIVKEAASREWFEGQLAQLIENSFAYLKSETTELKATIDLKPLTSGLAAALNKKLQSSIAGLPEGVSIPEVTAEQLGFPDSIDVTDFLPETQLIQARDFISIIYSALNYLLIASLVFLALIALIHRNLKKTAQWFGGNLLFNGIMLAISVYLMPSIVNSTIASATAGQPAQIQSMLQSLTPLLIDFFNAAGSKIMIYASAFIVAGIILFVLGKFVLKEKQEPKKQKQEEKPEGEPEEEKQEEKKEAKKSKKK
ncbi:hypothetical protein HZB89_00140 [archaeon]|nr:hypothetical protein [archaeon]